MKCKYCNGEYNTEMYVVIKRIHSSDKETCIIEYLNYCPICGEKIKAEDKIKDEN